MLFAFVGLTAIDVSLCGPIDVVSQSVFALAPVCAGVVQIAVPVLTAGAVPNTALGDRRWRVGDVMREVDGCDSSSARAGVTPASTRTAAPRSVAIFDDVRRSGR